MNGVRIALVATVFSVLASGCALRASDVRPSPVDAAEFAAWDCARLHQEMDGVRRAATRLAYAFDAQAGNNIIAMGLGMTVFWPALLAMRSTQAEAQELAALKGRHEALVHARQSRPCAERAPAVSDQELPIRVGDVLVYEQRADTRRAVRNISLNVVRLSVDGLELALGQAAPAAAEAVTTPSYFAASQLTQRSWLFDRSGNLQAAPMGPIWPELLRSDLELGDVISGELHEPGDPRLRVRLRGQVVALGPQVIDGRRFDAAIIDLFGDVLGEATSGRLDGVIVVDRLTGLLLRLDLYSAEPGFQMQRRLTRIQPTP